jgi:hypothetical protein
MERTSPQILIPSGGPAIALNALGLGYYKFLESYIALYNYHVSYFCRFYFDHKNNKFKFIDSDIDA